MIRTLYAGFLALSLGVAAQAAEINVAQGATVTLASGSVNGAALSTLTDGNFLPEGNYWQTNTVWWNGTGPTLKIDLGQSYSIDGAIVQADNNDSYLLTYSNDGTTWSIFWAVPFADNGGGLATRPNSNQSTIQSLPSVTARYFEFSAVAGDNDYSVSEIQLFETPSTPTSAPEPASLGLLGGSLAGLAWLLRRKRARNF
jgi:F5/8 type C domain/PEP-CTERM motif